MSNINLASLFFRGPSVTFPVYGQRSQFLATMIRMASLCSLQPNDLSLWMKAINVCTANLYVVQVQCVNIDKALRSFTIKN